MIEPNSASLKFVDNLKASSKPKWLSLKELIKQIEYIGVGGTLWGVINSQMNVVPVELEILSWTEVIKSAEVVDIDITCYSMQESGDPSRPFKVKGSVFCGFDKNQNDTVPVNYLAFNTFSRIFKSEADRDDFIDELVWLDGLLAELSAAYNKRAITSFLKFHGDVKRRD